MRIGIIGTRGIPNHYGGFEQFAEYLAPELVKRGHEVAVYCQKHHPYASTTFQGVDLIKCADPEFLGTASQFIYDLNCILDSRKRSFDVILQLGYTSSSIWHWALPKSSVVITNMDGLEWKRSKYKPFIQQFLKYAESLAVKNSDKLVADSVGIQDYLQTEYGLSSSFIAYGAEIPAKALNHHLNKFELTPSKYDVLIARIEPENNVEIILEAHSQLDGGIPLVVVGNMHANAFGQGLLQQYAGGNFLFVGAIYEKEKLDALRQNCRYYFHGHSVGGTNPSLLEAMACGAKIIAHDNPFNRGVLKDFGRYFDRASSLLNVLQTARDDDFKTEEEIRHIEKDYHWNGIVDAYEYLFMSALK